MMIAHLVIIVVKLLECSSSFSRTLFLYDASVVAEDGGILYVLFVQWTQVDPSTSSACTSANGSFGSITW